VGIAFIEAELKRKQLEITATNKIEKQRIEADMWTQISLLEAMKRREAEFMVDVYICSTILCLLYSCSITRF